LNRTNDGSLSDSNYATFAESRSPFSWLHPASTYSSSVANSANPCLNPANPNLNPDHPFDISCSNESLNSVTSSIQVGRYSVYQNRFKSHSFSHDD